MKKVFLTLTTGILLMSFVASEAGSWTNDKAHSRLGFAITHMGIADVNGEFSSFETKITTPNGDFTGATIEMTAEAKSVNTGLSMRDDHLRTADFFNVEKYPSITFKSTSVKKGKGKNTYGVTGDLTMLGVTKPVTFTAVHNGTVKNQAGNDLAGFRMTGVVKRSDFKLAEAANSYLSDEVKFTADLEVAKN